MKVHTLLSRHSHGEKRHNITEVCKLILLQPSDVWRIVRCWVDARRYVLHEPAQEQAVLGGETYSGLTCLRHLSICGMGTITTTDLAPLKQLMHLQVLPNS